MRESLQSTTVIVAAKPNLIIVVLTVILVFLSIYYMIKLLEPNVYPLGYFPELMSFLDSFSSIFDWIQVFVILFYILFLKKLKTLDS